MATKHVVALEDRLGVKVFHRTTRSVTLTEAGRRYLEFCERILIEMDEAETCCGFVPAKGFQSMDSFATATARSTNR